MAKNTSILLGPYFENFIQQEVSSGKFSSASEVIRTALRLLEEEELKTKSLLSELEAGEQSSMVTDFNPKSYLTSLHNKHLKK
ncbi:MAG: type II toxin-antitoxin system ParD family antitoxin [Chitinophagaceae bacterium]|jgi:antitoxin ParD1/3/4